MSRICGLTNWPTEQPPAQLLNAMLRVATTASYPSTSLSHEQTALGWVGWRQSNCACQDGILAAVDGCFFNRRELPGRGPDAEVLLRLYRDVGFVEALRRVNGDFAAALYDPATATLWLGRDRLGVKPLYYTRRGGALAFASRPRCLLSLPGVSKEVNRRYVALFAASHYRCFDNDPEASPYADIAQLPAGQVLSICAGEATRTTYWSLANLPDWTELGTTAEQLAEQYRELLLDAVKLRVRAADRPVFTLSGGMDSSSVLACAVRATGSKQPAVSTVYEDKTYDESAEIATVLERTVSTWHTVRVGTPDVLTCVQRMIAVHDEPVATATWLSHFLLCEQVASLGYGGLFGGLGGDELNAGEYEYFHYHFADLRACGQEEQLQHEIRCWVEHHDHAIFRKNAAVAEDNLRRLVDLSKPGRCLPDRQRLGRYMATLNPEYYDLASFVPVMDHPFCSYLKNRTLQDLLRETAPCCLRAEDRQATAFGLDNFLPFFDHRLVEFMFRVPGILKIRDGVTKRLLRKAMKGILPDETRLRIKKTGWNAPAHQWFSGRGAELLLDLVHSQSFRQRGIYNCAVVERLLAEHQNIVTGRAAQDNHMMFFWQLVNLETWLGTL